MVAVAISSLGVAYAQSNVIDGLSLDIPSGCFFTLLGPSGCGKTTLLRALAGFLPVADGAIRFGEKDVTHLPAHKRDIGMVFQDYALFPDKTVYDNVAYGLRARNVSEADVRKRVGEALERVGLQAFPQRRPAELSGGQRQRVALARAMVIRPSLLLMDEPLSNLDAQLRLQVREMIAELQREAGITTVFVTHDQEEALALSDRIGLMKQGRLEQVGRPEEIYRRPVSSYVADFVGAANILTARVETAGAGRLRASLRSGAVVEATALQAVQAGDVRLIARPEDIGLVPPGRGLEGRIAARHYLGGSTRYGVALTDGARLSVALHGADHDRYAIGEQVGVVLDAARTLAAAQ